MEFGELIRKIPGKVIQASDLPFFYVATDSRSVVAPEQTLFFAQKGPNHDGHDYLVELYERGVRLFVVEQPIALDLRWAGILLVKKSLNALQVLAENHRNQFGYPVIGITGSNGKTTVKEWLAMLLEDHFQVVKSPKSFNSQLGVPLSIFEMADRHNLAILEAGVSKMGEMTTLAQLIKPTLGIFTNIGPAHDEGFPDRKSKAVEKAKLFATCDKIICCHDHQLVRTVLQDRYGESVLTWSLEGDEADIQFKLVDDELHVSWKEANQLIRVPFTEAPQLENLLHVLVACLWLDLDLSLIPTALSSLRNIEMRLALKRGTNDCYLIDDSYNNDLSGIGVALNILDQQRQQRDKTVILSDILQTGLPDTQLYSEVNDLLEKHKVNRLIGVGPKIQAASHLFSMRNAFYSSTEELINELPVFDHELILVKGARIFKLERVVRALEEKHHGTKLVLHFEKVLHNLNTFRNQLKGGKLMVMVKAHAYGGGSYELANFLQYHKVDYLGVAYVNEGIDLRKNGLHLPIMVMNPDWDALPLFGTYDLEPEIYSVEMLRHFTQLGIQVPVHLKIETGMNRLGFLMEELEEVIQLIQSNKLKVQSIFTHLAAAENPQQDDYSKEQIRVFEEAYDIIVSNLGYAPLKHALNTAGIVRWPEFHFDMVRLGIGLYGVDPSGQMELSPVSTFVTEVSQVKHLKKGATIGYGRMGIAKEDMTIATLPVGYADGYRRSFGLGKADVSINGHMAPTIGNICMDMMMIDVTGIPVQKGDQVVLFGGNPSIIELARSADTIPYEILTSISPRVKREYSWD